jgi:hypothetical protein
MTALCQAKLQVVQTTAGRASVPLIEDGVPAEGHSKIRMDVRLMASSGARGRSVR